MRQFYEEFEFQEVYYNPRVENDPHEYNLAQNIKKEELNQVNKNIVQVEDHQTLFKEAADTILTVATKFTAIEKKIAHVIPQKEAKVELKEQGIEG
jgi:hypothetical protein